MEKRKLSSILKRVMLESDKEKKKMYLNEAKNHAKGLNRWLKRYLPRSFFDFSSFNNIQNRNIEQDKIAMSILLRIKLNKKGNKKKEATCSAHFERGLCDRRVISKAQTKWLLEKGQTLEQNFSVLLYRELIQYLRDFPDPNAFDIFVENVIKNYEILKNREEEEE